MLNKHNRAFIRRKLSTIYAYKTGYNGDKVAFKSSWVECGFWNLLNQRQKMNENEMLNDKPIFVAKSRIFHGLILAATFLMMVLVIYFLAQEPKANKLKQVVGWFGVGFLGVGGVIFLYITLIFKKIMLFDDRIDVYCLNKVIVRAYSQIKSFKLFEYELTKHLILECEPKFMHAYLSGILLHKNELYKIKEILIKKGVKNNG